MFGSDFFLSFTSQLMRLVIIIESLLHIGDEVLLLIHNYNSLIHH